MIRNILLLCLPLLVVGAQVSAQNGCTDSRASNYSAGATVNDGSCQYTATSTLLLTKAPLPSAVIESSGLQYTDQRLWTFNDSGNDPILYRLDPNLATIQQQVRVSNFINVDWEDIAADAQYLYIGDFGNNNGDRRDLRILRVRKAAIGTGTTEEVAAEAIQFSYPDQTNFNPGTNNHNFDCEAFFFANDSLHLFTKNWADLKTTYYTVPATPGTHVARRRGSFNVNGLITAADLNAAGTEASLLGYNQNTGATFLWLLFDFPSTSFLQGNKRRIELPNALTIGQAEGLTFTSRYTMLLSNERVSVGPLTIPARLYELNASQWLAPVITTANKQSQLNSFTLFPNPASRTLHIQSQEGFAPNTSVVLQDLQGQTVLTSTLASGNLDHTIDIQPVAAGTYLLRIQSDKVVFVRKLAVQ
ncbi:T9SS type A sorting domain-containing protein [Hymenobacter sp. GOD-10R]|uniref:T9SS type A sorting domain-containing protein n=1 Tax=Hymenobacter sp. GOD-10R TaxID=3093922 RepID=UPI002D7A2F69|nr:T9SS type A sorting domain-containing protein [Hymenobacter sp. GOD-10R]WRQ26265.1 T9SS type A sorting domain-containing protein [Hymenobacter sp. GOD-10R]